MEISEDKLQELKEQAWLQGERAALIRQLSNVLKELSYDDTFTKEQLIKEREETISALRSICDKHGDNNWDEDLHLADVINKHLAKYLN